MAQRVLVCRHCGHINPDDGRDKCSSCWLLLRGVTGVSQSEGVKAARRFRLGLLRSRLLRYMLLFVLAIGLTTWGVLVFFNLGPNPPGAVTTVNASLNAGEWAQAGRTADNAKFTPEPAPHPRSVKWVHDTSQPLLSSPAVAGNRVYLTTQEGLTVALDRRTGELVWEYGRGFSAGFPASSSPAVAGDLVIAAVRPSHVVGLDRESGALAWEVDMQFPVLASPHVVDGSVYVGAGNGKLYALDAATGRKRWTFDTVHRVVEPVAFADDAVVVTNEESLVHIIDTNTGRKRLVYDTGAGSVGMNLRGGPTIHGDLAYFVTQGGKVWAVDRGAITYPFERAIMYWKTNLFLWGILSKPPEQKGTVWGRKVGGTLMHSPAIAHDMVYVGNIQGKVFALNAATGEERWSTQLNVDISSAPIVAGATLILGSEDGTLLGLNAHTGEVLWDFKTGGKISASPIVAGDTIYVASHDGKLYAIAGE